MSRENVERLGYDKVADNLTNGFVKAIEKFNNAGKQNKINHDEELASIKKYNPNFVENNQLIMSLDKNSPDYMRTDAYNPVYYDKQDLRSLSWHVNSWVERFSERVDTDEYVEWYAKRLAKLDWDNFTSPKEEKIKELREYIYRSIKYWYDIGEAKEAKEKADTKKCHDDYMKELAEKRAKIPKKTMPKINLKIITTLLFIASFWMLSNLG